MPADDAEVQIGSEGSSLAETRQTRGLGCRFLRDTGGVHHSPRCVQGCERFYSCAAAATRTVLRRPYSQGHAVMGTRFVYGGTTSHLRATRVSRNPAQRFAPEAATGLVDRRDRTDIRNIPRDAVPDCADRRIGNGSNSDRVDDGFRFSGNAPPRREQRRRRARRLMVRDRGAALAAIRRSHRDFLVVALDYLPQSDSDANAVVAINNL